MLEKLSKNTLISGLRACALALPLAGCACTSDGLELSPVREERMRVVFDWQGTDDISGTMTAKLADGRQFNGAYFRIARDLSLDRLNSLWDGWTFANAGWRHWSPLPDAGFLEHYDGKVVANLGAAGNAHMRCRFRLFRPSAGMRGGGEGACQLTDGTAVDATLNNPDAKLRIRT